MVVWPTTILHCAQDVYNRLPMAPEQMPFSSSSCSNQILRLTAGTHTICCYHANSRWSTVNKSGRGGGQRPRVDRPVPMIAGLPRDCHRANLSPSLHLGRSQSRLLARRTHTRTHSFCSFCSIYWRLGWRANKMDVDQSGASSHTLAPCKPSGKRWRSVGQSGRCASEP